MKSASIVYGILSLNFMVRVPCSLGNKALHLLTLGTKQELRVDLQNFSGEKAYAKYSSFSVGSESDKYKLTVGGYHGTAGWQKYTIHNQMEICY